jgi:hypothetical protein
MDGLDLSNLRAEKIGRAKDIWKRQPPDKMRRVRGHLGDLLGKDRWHILASAILEDGCLANAEIVYGVHSQVLFVWTRHKQFRYDGSVVAWRLRGAGR